jgi:hypothetical protein
MKVILTGLWIGFCAAAVALCGWGIVFVNTHPHADYRWCFWFWVSVSGPVILLVLRLWKWILTICFLAIGAHWFGKHSKTWELLAGAWIGWQVSKPVNQRRLGNYWRWLIAKPQGPGVLANADRNVLRFACLCGFAMYNLSVAGAFPHRHALSNATPIPEPTPPQSYSHW